VTMNSRRLRIYLNDHFAGAVAGEELAKRCLKHSRGTPLGEYLEGFIEEVRTDRGSLQDVMEGLGMSPDRVKAMAGVAVARALGAKPNESPIRYTPLNLLEDLETLSLGVEGKLAMWKSLLALAGFAQGIDAERMTTLARRAERQRRRLEQFRVKAAAETLG
jgi:hypothetical protein